jgi:hypothetical protein
MITRAFVNEEWRGQGFFKYILAAATILAMGGDVKICTDAEKSFRFAGEIPPVLETLSAMNELNSKIAKKMNLTISE